ncbi:MAG: CBS domain-containing protein [Candidatus Micrarchaeaceae archaeon]
MRLEMQIPKEFVVKTEVHDYKEKLPALISRLKAAGTIVVLRQGAYAGIVDDRALVSSNIAKMQNIQISKLATKAPLLNEKTSVDEALKYFYDLDVKALPYAQGKKVSGVVKRETLLAMLLSLHALSSVKANEIMTSPVIGIDSNASVAEAIATMQQKKIGRLLIISNGKPSGIVTNSDIAFALASPAERLPEMKKEAHALDDIKIDSISQEYLRTLDYNKSVDDAIKQFINNGISSLGVMREGKIIGILTARDILKAAISSINKQMPIYISGLEAYTKENEDEIRSALEKTADKIDRFAKLDVTAVFVTVKSKKSVYEINASVKFEKGVELRAEASGQMLDETVNELTKKLYSMARKYKEKLQTKKEGAERQYA